MSPDDINQDLQYYADAIIEQIDDLEGIAGPDTPEEYIEVMELLKAEIDKRITTCRTQIIEDETVMRGRV